MPNTAPGKDSRFATLLRQYRCTSGMSANSLARAVGIDPSYVTRMEHGERDPARRNIVLDMARAMDLEQDCEDALLAAAGYVPDSLLAITERLSTVSDPAIAAVRTVLDDSRLSEAGLTAFRQTIMSVCEHWGHLPVAELNGRPVSIAEAISTVAYSRGAPDEREPRPGTAGHSTGNSGHSRDGGHADAPSAAQRQRPTIGGAGAYGTKGAAL